MRSTSAAMGARVLNAVVLPDCEKIYRWTALRCISKTVGPRGEAVARVCGASGRRWEWMRRGLRARALPGQSPEKSSRRVHQSFRAPNAVDDSLSNRRPDNVRAPRHLEPQRAGFLAPGQNAGGRATEATYCHYPAASVYIRRPVPLGSCVARALTSRSRTPISSIHSRGSDDD